MMVGCMRHLCCRSTRLAVAGQAVFALLESQTYSGTDASSRRLGFGRAAPIWAHLTRCQCDWACLKIESIEGKIDTWVD